MHDLLIHNGLIFDGLGSAPQRASLAVEQGRVVAISDRIDTPARETIDAAGMWVTPGFLDIHTHYDLEVEIAPALLESVRHGVTSVVMGNCSLSATVGKPAMLADMFQRVETLSPELIRNWLQASGTWNTPHEYFEHLRSLPLGPNIAPLLGHSCIRAEVMGLERSLNSVATDTELNQMKSLATQALDAGCIGISIDMVPWHMMSGEFCGVTIPSQHADFREYAMLADVCRERDAVFQVTPNPQNMRSFANILLLSLGIVRKPLRITILTALDSVSDRNLWRAFPLTLMLFNSILGSNIRFQTLTEPFTVYSDGPVTPMFEEFPAGVLLNNAQTGDERRQLWANPNFRQQFRDEWTRGWRKTFHRSLGLMVITDCPDTTLIGKSIAQVAQSVGKEPVDGFIDLLQAYDTDLRWVATGANDRQEQRLALMKHPEILPGFTDAGAHVRNLGFYDGAISLLRQAVQTGFLTPEQAVARVTGEPARWFKLDTGTLTVGAKADLVLIHPEGLATPIAPQVEILDPVLNHTPRMVKRGSDAIIDSVFIAGRRVFHTGSAQSILGTEPLGEVLAPTPSLPDFIPESHRFRNRINDEVVDHPFTDYWEIFVLKHQNPWNVAFHCLGVVYFYGVMIWAIVVWNFWLLLLLPVSQVIGLVGHFLFERSHVDLQDAIFSRRASRCLNKMFWFIVTGSYFPLVRQLRAQLETYQRQHQPSRFES